MSDRLLNVYDIFTDGVSKNATYGEKIQLN